MALRIGDPEFRSALSYWGDLFENLSEFSLSYNREMRFASKYALIACAEHCVIMGEEMLARYGVMKPETSPSVFYELSKNHIIPKNLAKDLADLYRFRNDIAHQELSLDSVNLYEGLTKYYVSVHDFYEITLKWERNHTGKKLFSQIYDGTGVMSTIRSIFK